MQTTSGSFGFSLKVFQHVNPHLSSANTTKVKMKSNEKWSKSEKKNDKMRLVPSTGEYKINTVTSNGHTISEQVYFNLIFLSFSL